MNQLVANRDHVAEAYSKLAGGANDLEKIMPLDLIREHTKTQDVPTVSDIQLMLYRRASLEAAQKYTGMLFTERKVVTEVVYPPNNTHRRFFYHTTKFAFSLPFVYFYAHANEPVRQFPVNVGESKVRLPVLGANFGIGCCNPCHEEQDSGKLMYTAGHDCQNDLPAAIVLGALKYIAHVIENPGDVVSSVLEAGSLQTGRSVGSANNPSLASGAIEIWRSVLDHSI